MPIPSDVLVEGGAFSNSTDLPYGDHHILMLDANDCRLYETFHSYPISGSATWRIFGSAIFDLRSNALRPDGWTAADAAGFPILPLLLRVADINNGAISAPASTPAPPPSRPREAIQRNRGASRA